MKKYLIVFLISFIGVSSLPAQNEGSIDVHKKAKKENKNGVFDNAFYMRIGGGTALKGLGNNPNNIAASRSLRYSEIGTLFYIGNSFANKKMRVGIDVTYSSTILDKNDLKGSSLSFSLYGGGSSAASSYVATGPKIGPVISINPTNKIIIDVYTKFYTSISDFYSGTYERSDPPPPPSGPFNLPPNYPQGRYEYQYSTVDTDTYLSVKNTYGMNLRYKNLLMGIELYRSPMKIYEVTDYYFYIDYYHNSYYQEYRSNSSKFGKLNGNILLFSLGFKL